MMLGMQCETCHETFEGGIGMSFLWSNMHTERHKAEERARQERADMIRRRAGRAFGNKWFRLL